MNDIESRVRVLETEFQKATERSMLAKKAVKDAKALAKAAKKEKRTARKALIAGQEEHAAALLDADKEAKEKSRESKRDKPESRLVAPAKVRLIENAEKKPRSAVKKRKSASRVGEVEGDEVSSTNAETPALEDKSGSDPVTDA